MDDHRAERQERAAIDADETGYATTLTGAGGEPAAGDDARRPDVTPDDADGEQAEVAGVAPGGTAAGVVSPVPGTTWPDPLGDENDDRNLERRTE